MIKFSNVSRYYSQKLAVEDLSFSIMPDRITGLLGPNGSGKTTILRLLLRIIPPDTGVISLNGKAVDDSIYNLTGYLPEERGFYKKERVIDVFKFIAGIKSFDIKKTLPAFVEVLERFNLKEIQNRKGDEISKGQAQIVQIAIALSTNPQILVLDEPYSGLDAHNQKIFDELILSLKNQGKYIILSTHLIEQASSLIDDMVLINSGKLLYCGAIEKFMDNEVEEYIVEIQNENLLFTSSGGVNITALGKTKYQISFTGKNHSERILKELFLNNSIVSIEKVNKSLSNKYLSITDSVWD